MKKYTFIYIASVLSLLFGYFIYIRMIQIPAKQQVDMVAVNEIVQQSIIYWDNPRKFERLPRYEFEIYDRSGMVYYKSKESLPDNLTTALQQGFLPMNLMVNGQLIGTVVIETFPNRLVEYAQAKIAETIGFSFLILIAFSLLFLSVIHYKIVRPFHTLEKFAHKISTGILDEPLPMDKNNLFGLFTNSFDIMRISLFEARQKQLEAERAKKELVASLSHDIKTPLTSIRLIVELLQVKNSNPNDDEKYHTILSKTDQINRLMRDMMHNALEELGELNVTITSEDSELLRFLFKEADPYSKITVNHIPPCLIDMDIMRMEQIIGNIISNSYKYANTDIVVDFEIEDNLLRIDINDFGNGVSDEELELIFTKFYRGEQAKISTKEGEGLGLYIAHFLLNKMGGSLEALNRLDGFTIRMWLCLSY